MCERDNNLGVFDPERYIIRAKAQGYSEDIIAKANPDIWRWRSHGKVCAYWSPNHPVFQ